MGNEKRWTVYTPSGDYTGIWAESAYAAKRRVWQMALGRILFSDMVAVREG